MFARTCRYSLAALVFSTCTAFTLADAPVYPRGKNNPIVQAVKNTKPSIVTVRVPRPGGGKDMIGSGVIIDERGYIITNRHVVCNQQQVTIQLSDGTQLTGDVLVAESRCDLAVVRVQAQTKLTALTLGAVNNEVGETVIAVGHPFGYTNTVSVGIISALDREITMPTGDSIGGLIQTDASINPGNSGGPLLNVDGQLIGINVALREGANGIAFAINTGTVKNLLSKHLGAHRVAGVQHGLKCEEKFASESGDRQQVIVASCAVDTTVKTGDQIVSVGKLSVTNTFDLERALWDSRPGEQVNVRLIRQGQPLEVRLTLSAAASENGQLASR